jgi:ankyrin repeat protein
MSDTAALSAFVDLAGFRYTTVARETPPRGDLPMINPFKLQVGISALLLCLAFAPSVFADARLVPLDGSEKGIKPADFGYEIKLGRSGEDVMIHILLNPEAAKKFSHANLKLTSGESPAGRLEATLGLEPDADQGGRMRLAFRSGMLDDGELILWSEPFERPPAIGRFAGFRISIGTLLENAAPDGAGSERAEEKRAAPDARQALFQAIAEGRFDDVGKAVKAEPKLVDAEYKHGGTPLYWAAFHGHEKIAALLLDQGAQVNARGIESATPLYEAAYRGHAGTVKLLLKHLADVEAQNKSGHTPLYAAVSRCHEDVVRILLEAGANPNGPPGEAELPHALPRSFTRHRLAGASPLLVAVSSATKRTAETELTPEQKERAQARRQTIRRIAAALIVHPKARLDEPLLMVLGQRAPLHMTAIAGDVELTRLLLEHGANPNIRDRAPPTRWPRPDGFTPLHHAAAAGNGELMDLLIQHGANPNIKNSLGQTPADLLREQALSQHRAKPNTKNSLDQTPADPQEQEVQKPENLPVGRWKIEFANGVVETCMIRCDGTAVVAEPKRNSAGRAAMKDGALVITFDDDRIERWTPVGRRMVVEHWYPAEGFPSASPGLGIADRALTDDGAPGAVPTSASDSRPKKDWPPELVQVIDELQERGAPPKSVDVRYADRDAETPTWKAGFTGGCRPAKPPSTPISRRSS